jgi:hypothetical protein
MMNKTQTYELVVMRDGQLDEAYYKALEREQRIETVKGIGHNVIASLGAAVRATGQGIGEFALVCYHDSDLYRATQANAQYPQ